MKKSDYLISTPENVDLHLELAGLGCRIWAAFIDTLLLYLSIVLFITAAILLNFLLQQIHLPQTIQIMAGWFLLSTTLLIVFLINFGYFIYFEGFWQGQTPGKKLVQIRVIETNGQPVTWTAVWIRNLIRILDTGLALLGIVFMLVDRHERRLGDLAAGTLVIRERQGEFSPCLLKIQASTLESIDAGQISTDEYDLLLSFLKRRHTMQKESRSLLSRQLADYFRTKLHLEYKGESCENFLEKIYLTYMSRDEPGKP